MRRILCAVVGIALSQGAEAHSFYPHWCCNDRDCAPIRDLNVLPDGSMLITNENGDTAVFPKDFKIMEPQDDKDHACISKLYKQPMCLFLHARI